MDDFLLLLTVQRRLSPVETHTGGNRDRLDLIRFNSRMTQQNAATADGNKGGPRGSISLPVFVMELCCFTI